MGTMQADGVLVEFDDRLLAHLQIVIVQKLRRGESFLMSWRDAPESGNGNSALWLHPYQNLFFRFSRPREGEINPEWIEQLLIAANSPRGLVIMQEGSMADLSAGGENPANG